MSGTFFALILVLLVIFVIICVNAITKKQISYIYTNAENDADSIEAIVREILWRKSSSEIVIAVYGEDDEADEILKRLRKDFPQIHIIRN